jgi:two-component system, cell cycle sensor histidine kinase and response regulator CckA
MLKKRFSAFISFIIGPPERFPLEHRLFNAMVITIILINLLAFIQNNFIGLPFATMALAMVGLAVYCLFYAVSRFKGYYRMNIWPVMLITIVLLAVTWLFNEGSAGGTHIFLSVAPLLFILLIDNRLRLIFLLLYIGVTAGLLTAEYLNPLFVHGRLPRRAHFVDLLSATIQIQLVIAITVVWAVKEYRNMLGRVEHLRRKSEERFSEVADQIPALIVEGDLAMRLSYANRMAFQLTGYSPADLERGIHAEDVIHPDDIEKMREGIGRLLAGQEAQPKEYRIICKGGTEKVFLTKAAAMHSEGKVSGFRSYMIDVTEKKALEEDLRQSQKMESIGQLAGGIAHDFNNILTGILTSARFIEQEAGSIDRKDLAALAEPIVAASTRAAELIKNLLVFSRRKTYNNEPVDLRKTIGDAITILTHAIDKKTEIVQKLHHGPVVVRGDPALVESAVINLVLNARDAMPDGGRLTIELSRVSADGPFLRAHPDLTAGRDYAAVSVSDTGSGFSDEAKKHLFEPFFSTKEQGSGTGLGLASVFGVVKGHDGSIDVASSRGEGTTVTMYFPLSEGPGKSRDLRPRDLRGQASPEPEKGGGETILVIDDEEIILRTVEMTLKRQGFSVTAVRDPAVAIDYYRANATRIACVILDVIMPKMNGMACYSRLRAINPSVKVIMTTGYTSDRVFEEFVALNDLTVVPKPFDVPVLIEAIRRVRHSA